MAVSEPERHDLYQGLVEKLGRKRAETFMNLISTVPWSEVATKTDLERLSTKFATKSDLEAAVERMGRRIIMWTASSMVALAGLAFAAGRFI